MPHVWSKLKNACNFLSFKYIFDLQVFVLAYVLSELKGISNCLVLRSIFLSYIHVVSFIYKYCLLVKQLNINYLYINYLLIITTLVICESITRLIKMYK